MLTPTNKSSARRLTASLVAALAFTTLAPMAPVEVAGPVKVHASQLTHAVDGSHDFELPDGTTHIAIHWPGQPNARVEAAFSTDGSTFSQPAQVEIDEVGAALENGHTYGVILPVEGARYVRVSSDRPLPQAFVLALDAAGQTTVLGLGATTSASSQIPAVIPRSAWGADESLRFDENGHEIWTREYFPVQKLVVHHTAGRNHDPNPAATVRAIYYYHAVTQGWGDIGYHYVIDDAGRVYEGRYSRDYPSGVTPSADDEQGWGVVAGHARGFNAGSLGFSVLGTYTDIAPTAAAQQSLVRMLAWAAAKHGLDPRRASTYVNPISGATRRTQNIAGHRDYNSTACPGGVFYALLPSIRNRVAAELIERFGGADRYATAAAVSRRFFPSASTVFVASGRSFPDALAGGPAAAELDAPLLLTWPDGGPTRCAAAAGAAERAARFDPSRDRAAGTCPHHHPRRHRRDLTGGAGRARNAGQQRDAAAGGCRPICDGRGDQRCRLWNGQEVLCREWPELPRCAGRGAGGWPAQRPDAAREAIDRAGADAFGAPAATADVGADPGRSSIGERNGSHPDQGAAGNSVDVGPSRAGPVAVEVRDDTRRST